MRYQFSRWTAMAEGRRGGKGRDGGREESWGVSGVKNRLDTVKDRKG